MTITKFTCENLEYGCVTDKESPKFAYVIESERKGARIMSAIIKVNGEKINAIRGHHIAYVGTPLQPFTSYDATLEIVDELNNKYSKTLTFETGRMTTPWNAKWITDGNYKFTEKKTSPIPLTFKKDIKIEKTVKRAYVQATAIGIYNLYINDKKVSDYMFAPGFTSYKSQLQYQQYDITSLIGKSFTTKIVVGGGWAVGAFVFTRVNRVTAKRQALLAEVHIEYDDGTKDVVATDTSWQVTTNGKFRFTEFYDGEIYDNSIDESKADWHNAAIESVKINPQIYADIGALVTTHEHFKPIEQHPSITNGFIYDFGQNLAGVVHLHIKKATKGQKIVVRHAEILKNDGELHTAFLRSAKCKFEYTCTDGEQDYMPTMTYMGYRYCHVEGIEPEDVDVESVAIYSDMTPVGTFECSDARINKLQSNILWGAKSNLVDIPTDCPQRDERMGWTGDIAIFAPIACYNFDMSRFFDKWLKDVKSEQGWGGGIPNTVPAQGYGFPATMPLKAIGFWGDACVFVPYAQYMASGDIEILKTMYPVMKKYVKACKWWAGLFSTGKNAYIWNDIAALQFGDWVAPDVPKMSQWQARAKWTATASFAKSSELCAEVARVLGYDDEARYYEKLFNKISDAYISVLTDGNGKLKEEFQSAYVLPIHFKMFPHDMRIKATHNLVNLIEKRDYCIGTGFPGTPYILHALAENGAEDTAFKMLFNDKCPSWLYEVKVGGTTIWERWDALDEDGSCSIGDDGTGGMISFNHYGFGAVGNFLYEKLAGITPTSAGYKTFKIQPLVGGGLTSAKGTYDCPYGKIISEWKIEDGKFKLNIKVPVNTMCEVVLPDGTEHREISGYYSYECAI